MHTHFVCLQAACPPLRVARVLKLAADVDLQAAYTMSVCHAAVRFCRLHHTTRLQCQGLQLASDVELVSLASSCFGYSGADLAALVREAAVHAFSTAAAHILQQGESCVLEWGRAGHVGHSCGPMSSTATIAGSAETVISPDPTTVAACGAVPALVSFVVVEPFPQLAMPCQTAR